MSKPRPIKLRRPSSQPHDVQLSIVGYKEKNTVPYLALFYGSNHIGGMLGYVEDRDVKRLKAWCEDALRKRK